MFPKCQSIAKPRQGKSSPLLSVALSCLQGWRGQIFLAPNLMFRSLPQIEEKRTKKKKQCFLFSSHFCIQTFDSRRFFQSTVKLFHESEDLRDIFHRSFHFLPKAMISPRQPARLCTRRSSCATIWRLLCAKYLPSTPTFYRSLRRRLCLCLWIVISSLQKYAKFFLIWHWLQWYCCF